jgi:hypothetical protein
MTYTLRVKPAIARKMGLAVLPRAKSVRIGRARTSLTRPGRARVVLRPRYAVRLPLRSARRLTVIVQATLRDLHGRRAAARRTVRLKR